MRKTSTQIYDEIVIDKVLQTSDNRKLIEEWIENIRAGKKNDYESLIKLILLVEEYPALDKYVLKELTEIHNRIVVNSELTEEAFDKQLDKLEEL